MDKKRIQIELTPVETVLLIDAVGVKASLFEKLASENKNRELRAQADKHHRLMAMLISGLETQGAGAIDGSAGN